MPMMCPHCRAEIPDSSAACPRCGEAVANPFAAPASGPFGPSSPSTADETVATVIPYKNPPALIAYYLGLFSCFPLLGFPLAVAALVLAILGFKKVRREPSAHGTAHAWIGLICGLIGLLINLLMIAGLIAALVASATGRR